MNKILKLFINENIKTWKKFSTKLMLIFIIIALLGTLGFVKISENLSVDSQEIIDENWKKDMKEQIDMHKEELNDETLSDDIKKNIEETIQVKQLYLELNINPYSNHWKSEILRTLITGINGKTELIDLVKNGQYSEYIQMQKEEQKELLKLGQISQEEYNDEMLVLDLIEKYEIGENYGEESMFGWKELIISDIRNLQRSVREGKDYSTSKVLSSEQKKQFEDEIQMNIYKLENNIQSVNYNDTNYRIIFETLAPSAVITMIAVAAIIIAGGAIAQEVSTGTIKFWALTPNKRWKILTAKILSVIFYIVIITLIMSILNIILANIFFDTQGNQYVYIKNGEAKCIGNELFIIGMYFAKSVPVIVFTLFAIMLSTITRSSSVALSLGVATYIGNSVVMTIINQFIKKEWIRYVPFNNLNIADKIFPNFENSMKLFGETYATNTSLTFSLVILVVCSILMLVTTYDSFNKRDII